MKKFLQEFKEFAMRGNMIDMAVGIIIGAAFGKIVSSLVADVIMPPLGLLIGGVDFTDLAITLKRATGDDPAVLLRYGGFPADRRGLPHRRFRHLPHGEGYQFAAPQTGGQAGPCRSARTYRRGETAHRDTRPAEEGDRRGGPEPLTVSILYKVIPTFPAL